MSHRIKLSNYVHLGIQSTFFFLAVKCLPATLHEIGHGLGGWLAGLKFLGFYFAVFGGCNAYISAGSRKLWQSVLTSAAGPAVDLIFGLIIVFIILPRVKRWVPRLFWLFWAVATLLGFWAYMVIGGFLESGDFANLSRFLGINRFFVGIIGLGGLVLFAFLLTRQIFHTLSPYFILSSFWMRFRALFLLLGFPFLVYVGVGYLLYPGQILNLFLLSLSLTIIILGLLSLVRPEASASLQNLPKWPSLIGILTFIIVTTIWLGIFGLREEKARGLLWTTPEENRVSACNIIILLKNDFSAQIDFLMRSHPKHLFWEKMKNKTPNWPVYTKFVRSNLPDLLGISDYKAVEKINDVNSPFYYYGTSYKGARRIKLVVNLDGKVQKADENTYAFEITDFWHISGGYLDKLKIILEEGMKFSDYELTPKDAKRPDFYREQEITWENMNSSAPEKVRLIISF